MINIINAIKQFNWYQILVLEVDDSSYGYNCIKNCSGHCLNNSPCNKQTGHCDGGCKLGYTTDNCSKGDALNRWIYFSVR